MIIYLVRRLRRWFVYRGQPFTLVPTNGYQYIGTEYGGWPVVVELMNKSSVVLSFGLGTDISFDLGVIEQYGVTVHGFDPTPKSLEWLSNQNLPEQFSLHPVGLADQDGELQFEAPTTPGFASWTAAKLDAGTEIISFPVKSLSTICRELDIDRIDVLKMDIEGSENSVISQLVAGSLRPKQILVEFHHRIHGTPVQATIDAIRSLEEIGYAVFYISSIGDEFALVHNGAAS